MEGLNNLFKQLFDVKLQPVEVEIGEVWSYDVHKLVRKINMNSLIMVSMIFLKPLITSGTPSVTG